MLRFANLQEVIKVVQSDIANGFYHFKMIRYLVIV